MFFITSDKYRIVELRDHIDLSLPIWTKNKQFAVEVGSSEYLNPNEKTVDKLPEGWVTIK